MCLSEYHYSFIMELYYFTKLSCEYMYLHIAINKQSLNRLM